MRPMLSHGLSPRKPGSVSRFSGPPPVHPEGCTPDRRPILALTQFWCIRGLVGAEESGLKEIELSTAIHLAFHQLELCDLALCLAVGPSQSDCGADGGLVFDDPGGE